LAFFFIFFFLLFDMLVVLVDCSSLGAVLTANVRKQQRIKDGGNAMNTRQQQASAHD
jgi:competence protein ComGC